MQAERLIRTADESFGIRARDGTSLPRLLSGTLLQAARAFVDGTMQVDGDMIAALRWWYDRQPPRHRRSIAGVLAWLRLEHWFQTKTRARRNIEFHYDRSNAFYQQFLDRRMLYSSAYFQNPSMSLDAAQEAKLNHIVRKLDVRPAHRFADIGCGWGALVMHVAEKTGAMAVGCTLSSSQFQLAAAALCSKGLERHATIELCDYRTLSGPFDRIASVGMYEHVGRHRLGEYFRMVAELLPADGLFLNSGITRPETVHDDDVTTFLHQFVFPGGEIPYLAETIRAAEAAGLQVVDIESLRHHYALTCARWLQRLQERRDACLALIDLQTYRVWQLYLAGSVVSFERGESELYQILFAKRGRSQPHWWTRRGMYC